MARELQKIESEDQTLNYKEQKHKSFHMPSPPPTPTPKVLTQPGDMMSPVKEQQKQDCPFDIEAWLASEPTLLETHMFR